MTPLEWFKAGALAYTEWTKRRIGRKLFPKFFAKRDAKRAKEEIEDLSILETKEAEGMSVGLAKELALSLLRHAVPALTAFLAGYGIHVTDETNPVLLLLMAVVVYLAAQVWSWGRKILNKPRES